MLHRENQFSSPPPVSHSIAINQFPAHPDPAPVIQMSEDSTSADDLPSDVTEDALDVQLMMRVAQKDESAFEQLIERHQGAVIGTVAKMLGNPSDAEDIAQQVFLRLWKYAPKYRPKAKFTTFMFTITRNLVFNESKKRSRRKEHSMDEREDDFHIQIPDDDSAAPDQEMLQHELEKAVDRAIASLPEKQRLAVIMRRYENLPYEEIASILELSVSAVKSQLFRARNALRESLEQYLNA